MQNILKIKLILLIFSLLCSLPLNLEAASKIQKSIKLEKEKVLKSKKKKEEKVGFLKKWFQKRIVKKFEKFQSKNSLEKDANLGLGFGIASIFALILAIATVTTTGWLIFILAGILAIFGDVFSITALAKYKKLANKTGHELSHKKAVWGLVFSLLTGLIPLMIFFLVLISFSV